MAEQARFPKTYLSNGLFEKQTIPISIIKNIRIIIYKN